MLRCIDRTTAVLLTGLLVLPLLPRTVAANAPLTTEEILSGTKATKTTDKPDPGLITGDTELTKMVLDGPLGGSSRFDSIAGTQKLPKDPKGSGGSENKPPRGGDIPEPGTAGLLLAGAFGLLVLGRRRVL
jgi:hypothetical protein